MNAQLVREASDMIRKGLEMLLESSRTPTDRGVVFEKEFVEMCRERGISACLVKGKGNVDAVVNGHRVQIKDTPHPKRGRIGVYNGHKKAYDADDFDVLVVRASGAVFIVPAIVLLRSDGKMKQHLPLAKCARWQDAWCVFEAGGRHPVSYERQMRIA